MIEEKKYNGTKGLLHFLKADYKGRKFLVRKSSKGGAGRDERKKRLEGSRPWGKGKNKLKGEGVRETD